MLIYDILKSKRKFNIHKTSEYLFFEENKKIISKIKDQYCLSKNQEFNLIFFNILIKAFQTKEGMHELIDSIDTLSIEQQKEKIKKYIETRPFVELNSEKIYLPQFSKALNYIYINEPMTLKKYPYSKLKDDIMYLCINSFDDYGYAIFASSFTNLKLILKDKTSAAFYSDDLETIFVINDQGSLDVAIYLFDKYLVNKNKDNIIERCQKVMKEFFENKESAFIKALYEENFISLKMKAILKRNISKRKIKRIKKHGVKNEKI